MFNRRLFCLTALSTPFVATRVAASEEIYIRDLYDADDGITDLARELEGSRIDVFGHMAPPLKADLKFFVLTAQPMGVCPFCEGVEDWVPGILPVVTKRDFDTVAFYRGIVARGVFRLDFYREPETNFAVKFRLDDGDFRSA